LAKKNPKLVELPKSVNELIADRAIRHALYLERHKTHIVNQLLTEFNNSLEPALVAKIEKSLRRVTGTSKQLQSLFKYNGELVRDQYITMQAKLYSQLKDFTEVESAWLIKTMQNVTPIAYDFVAPSAGMLKSLVTKQPMEGALVKEWFGKLSKDTAFNVNRQIQMGMVEGEGIAKIVRRIKGTRAAQYTDGILNASRHNLNSVVRTATSNVAHGARDEVYKANTDVVKGVQIIATLDTRTCMVCMDLDGKVYQVGEGRRPPFHYSCLPGNSLVTSSSGIVSASKRWFDGEMVVIETASGRKLTCTPNHPVLTDKGWVAANRLDVGRYVVSDGGRQWESPFVNINGYNIPAPIEDIFESSFRSPDMQSIPVPLTAEDFHGDGIGGQIAIITSNGFLGDSRNAAINQHLSQDCFIGTKKTLRNILFSAKSKVTPFFFRAYSTLVGFMSSLCQFGDNRRRRPIHSDLLLLTAVPQSDIMFFEDSQNWLSGTSKFFGYSLGSDSIFVKLKNFIFRQADHSGFYATQRNSGLNKNPPDNLISNRKTTSNTSCRFPFAVKLADFFRRQFFFVASDSDSIVFQNSGDSGDGDSVLAADILSGNAGPVFLDYIVNVRRFNFAGHVYNLETENNFYSAQGIITHNCRCTSAPALKSWKELGIPLKELPPGTRASSALTKTEKKRIRKLPKDVRLAIMKKLNGQVPATQKYPEWFAKQTKAFQAEAFGGGKAGIKRAEYFRSGKVKLSKFVDQRNRPLTLKQLEELSKKAG